MLIYRILLPAEWDEFEASGRFDGSALDKKSGFIHCSSREQVSGTAVRVFGDEPELVIVAVDSQVLSEHLRWEQASNGGTFPHLYAPLPLSAVVAVHRIDGASTVDNVIPQ